MHSEILKNFMKKKYINKIIVAFLIIILGTACREQIVHNLSEADANRLHTRLTQSGIKPEKVKQTDGKWALAVDRQETALAINLLDQNRALKTVKPSEDPGAGIFASSAQKHFSLLQILAVEIENSLSALKGVLEVHVHIFDSGEINPWEKSANKNIKESAAVLLITNPEFDTKIEDIQRLVAGASGRTPTDIAVINNTIQEPVDESELISGTAKQTIVHSDRKYIYYFIFFLLVATLVLIRKKSQKLLQLKKNLVLPEIETDALK